MIQPQSTFAAAMVSFAPYIFHYRISSCRNTMDLSDVDEESKGQKTARRRLAQVTTCISRKTSVGTPSLPSLPPPLPSSLPFSLPSLTYPFSPLPFRPFPSPPLRSRPHIAARRYGERLSSPSGSG